MTVLFNKGREGFLDGSIDFDTDTIKAALLDLNTADVGVKAITAATNATPIVVTATAHGFTNGDNVFIDGVGGNLAANGVWKIASVTANTFELQRPDGTNAAGSAAYTSGGYAVNLGPSASGDFWDDFDACLVGAAVTLTGPTVTSGVADANDTTFTAVTGASVEAIGLFKSTGTNSTSRMIALITGKHVVTVNTAPSGTYTTVAVEPLAAGIPNGSVLTFSNGQTVTTNAVANAGDRSITVVSTTNALTAASRALAPITGSGLPVTPNGGDITVAWDNGANKIFKL